MSPQSRYTLLQPEDKVEPSSRRPRWERRSWSDVRGSWSFIHPVLLYLTIFILLKTLYDSGNQTTKTSSDPSQLTYCEQSLEDCLQLITSLTAAFIAPAQSAINYEVEVFPENLWTKTPYMTKEDGFPSNETDELWDELYKRRSKPYIQNTVPQPSYRILLKPSSFAYGLQDGIVEVAAEEATMLPNTTAELPHKSDFYVVEIDVFHQLHCLNYIRKALYPDRYMKDFRDAYNDDGKRNYNGHDSRHYGQ